MARTGDERRLGTAEGAAMGRAGHSLHAEAPVLDDFWAIELIAPSARALVREQSVGSGGTLWDGFDTSPLFALNVGSLRYAEDEVERCARAGIDQYLILGAGFDSFALRRADLVGSLRVFEVDHPDVQALKRSRIAEASRKPASLPIFVPVDFERVGIREGLAQSGFDPRRRSVVSWMNTLPYLSATAIEATLRDIASLAAAGSRLVLNYACDVPQSEAQSAYLRSLRERLGRSDEPMHPPWRPDDFEALLTRGGFSICEHASERDLEARYFSGRSDGLAPRTPARLVVAERSPETPAPR
jgi:methyltransferase (TIGR00027 family)